MDLGNERALELLAAMPETLTGGLVNGRLLADVAWAGRGPADPVPIRAVVLWATARPPATLLDVLAGELRMPGVSTMLHDLPVGAPTGVVREALAGAGVAAIVVGHEDLHGEEGGRAPARVDRLSLDLAAQWLAWAAPIVGPERLTVAVTAPSGPSLLTPAGSRSLAWLHAVERLRLPGTWPWSAVTSTPTALVTRMRQPFMSDPRTAHAVQTARQLRYALDWTHRRCGEIRDVSCEPEPDLSWTRLQALTARRLTARLRARPPAWAPRSAWTVDTGAGGVTRC